MARLTKIVPSNSLSRFQQVGAEAGSGLAVVSAGLEALYSRFGPAAMERMKQTGEQAGREAAGATSGDLEITYPEDGKQALDRAISPNAARNAALASGGGPTNAAADMLDFSAYEQQHGLPAGYLSRTAQIESGMNPNAKNPNSSAEGLFQFIDSTARDYGLTNKRDAGASTDAASRLAADNAATLRNATGREPTAAELYLAHQQGGGGAAKLLSNPSARAVDVVGADQVRLNGGNADMTAGQFASLWLDKFNNGTVSTQGGVPATPAVQAKVTLRNSKGNLESRMYSPLSGPILQAHNLAAAATYQSEVIDKGATDLIEIGMAFEFDPVGFEEAAQGYIDQIVQDAPAEFKGALRGSLEKQADRRRLGIYEERQRETRTRASNSNKALVDRYSDDYANALANEDPDQIAESRALLDDALRNRELLPGVGWTLEQSGNTIISATRAAERVRAARDKEYQTEVKDNFSLITKAAKDGATASGEEILTDPAAIAADPEGAREAAAFVALRDGMPEFLQMTPDQMFQSVAEMDKQEISEGWQLDVREAARKMASENRKAWEDDPVKRAGEVLQQDPPDISEAIATGDPAQITTAMTSRREYMLDVFDDGYTSTRAFLSTEEAEQMQTLMGKGTDPSIRAAVAGSIVSGFGSDATRVFDEINGDPLTMYAGKVLSVGGQPALAGEILRGQTIMDEGIVKVPTDATVRDTFNTEFQSVLARVPGGIAAQKEITMAARAIYAARAVGAQLDEAGEADLMAESINAAMGGGRNKRGEATGGVQQVMSSKTLLPVGVSGVSVDKALRGAMGGMPYGDTGFLSGLANLGAGLAGQKAEPVNLAPFAAASQQGVPHWNGAPLDPATMPGAEFGITSIGGQGYMLEVIVGNQSYEATSATGGLYVFQLDKFMEARSGAPKPLTSTPSMMEPFSPSKHTPRDNGDGSHSTEIEITNDAPDGGYWNIPSLWFKEDGTSVELDADQAQRLALKYERETGKKFPRFNSIDEAVDFAEKRSAEGGASNGELAQ